MRPVSIAPSVTQSEASVVSPYRPQTAPAAVQQWINSDHPLQPKPARFSTVSAPAHIAVPVRPQAVAQPSDLHAEAPVVSPFRKLGALAGILMCSVGVVGGFISMVALGPVGIAVAAGAAIVGGILIAVSTRT